MKNMAAQKTVWNLADTGIIEVIPKPNKMDYQALPMAKTGSWSSWRGGLHDPG